MYWHWIQQYYAPDHSLALLTGRPSIPNTIFISTGTWSYQSFWDWISWLELTESLLPSRPFKTTKRANSSLLHTASIRGRSPWKIFTILSMRSRISRDWISLSLQSNQLVTPMSSRVKGIDIQQVAFCIEDWTQSLGEMPVAPNDAGRGNLVAIPSQARSIGRIIL